MARKNRSQRKVTFLNEEEQQCYEGYPNKPLKIISYGKTSKTIYIFTPTDNGLSLNTMKIPYGMQ